MFMIRKSILTVLTVVLLAPVLPLQASSEPQSSRSREAMAGKIRKELVTLPFFGVFDNLSFKIEENTVTLYGQVTRPSLKSSAERVVEKVNGVEEVINKIEVLPLSPMDDRIRIATYRAIYGQVGLDRLSLQANPPIHIIVKNGHVTLEGVVNSRSDSTRAFLAANGVPNVFSVTNKLRIERN
ncbi:MAG: BON domain-containing protein [Acidobacteriota bacterium]|nr:MAG: BON domain-containing protein [Acidobacteriota bacterium]